MPCSRDNTLPTIQDKRIQGLNVLDPSVRCGTKSRKRRPRVLLRMADVVLRTISASGLCDLRLNVNAIVEEASAGTALDQHCDSLVLIPLGILVDSFNRDAELNSLGRTCAKYDLIRTLRNYLNIISTRGANPEIQQEKINSPLFITGLPRSGTTLLHSLLAQDPASRVPRVWETMYPCPPPETLTYQFDQRIAKAEQDLRWLDFMIPDFKRAHLIGATLPQECIVLTEHIFRSQAFESMYYVKSYRSWHEQEDKLPEYEFHKKYLQHLQWLCPGERWVLKAPSHLFGLDSIMRVYPDAKIIFTHRDPLKVIPSCASFSEILRSPFRSKGIERKELGEEISSHWAKGSNNAISFRKKMSDDMKHSFLDINYCDLTENPIETVQKIYDHFRWNITDESILRMKRFLAENPINRNGKHDYSLGEYGLDSEEETHKFRSYIEYFGVEPEF